MKIIEKYQPYQHFNGPNSDCYNKLFEGVDVDEDEDEYEDHEFLANYDFDYY